MFRTWNKKDRSRKKKLDINLSVGISHVSDIGTYINAEVEKNILNKLSGFLSASWYFDKDEEKEYTVFYNPNSDSKKFINKYENLFSINLGLKYNIFTIFSDNEIYIEPLVGYYHLKYNNKNYENALLSISASWIYKIKDNLYISPKLGYSYFLDLPERQISFNSLGNAIDKTDKDNIEKLTYSLSIIYSF